uniref:Uncharacterized protein n=1 Tax=Cacopsylla melanoneura TaxID=428564 RepID=A0A8D8QHD6_9HEMI
MDNESANIKRKRDMISPELPVGKRALLFDKESDPLDDTAGGDISLGEDLSDPLLALESSLLAMERIINKRKGERLSAKYFGPLTNLIANGKSAIATIKEGLVDRVQTALQPWIVDLVRRELSEAKSQTKTDAGMQPSVSYAQVVAIGSTGSRQLPGAKCRTTKPPSPRRGFVVRPGEGQTVEALRNELQKSINPSDHGVGIKRLITAKDGLRVEVNSEATTDTIKSLRDAVAAKQPEATTCDLHEHRLPRIVVYDVKLEVESNESFKETFCDQKFCRRRAQT